MSLQRPVRHPSGALACPQCGSQWFDLRPGRTGDNEESFTSPALHFVMGPDGPQIGAWGGIVCCQQCKHDIDIRNPQSSPRLKVVDSD